MSTNNLLIIQAKCKASLILVRDWRKWHWKKLMFRYNIYSEKQATETNGCLNNYIFLSLPARCYYLQRKRKCNLIINKSGCLISMRHFFFLRSCFTTTWRQHERTRGNILFFFRSQISFVGLKITRKKHKLLNLKHHGSKLHDYTFSFSATKDDFWLLILN